LTIGEESGGATSSEEGATAVGATVGSSRRVSHAERSAVVKTVDGPSRGELVIDVVTIGSCESDEVIETSTSVEGLSRTVASGSRRVIKALTGASTPSGTPEAESFWRGGSSPLETSTTTGYRGREHD
jgi:hypothetical protein